MKETTTHWNYTSTMDDECIPSLHDAVVTNIQAVNGELVLSIPNGFKLLPWDPKNPYDEFHMTRASQVVFSQLLFAPEESVNLEVFREYWLRPLRRSPCVKPLFAVCRFPSFAKQTEKINSGKWTLWFTSQFPSSDMCPMFECCIHTGRRMHRCYLTVEGCKQILFRWNEIDPAPERL